MMVVAVSMTMIVMVVPRVTPTSGHRGLTVI
jgi:hypothetical protein